MPRRSTPSSSNTTVAPGRCPLVLRRDPALAAAERLFAGGERRLRALTETLSTHVIAEATWRTLDPDARTLRDIDTPADLDT